MSLTDRDLPKEEFINQLEIKFQDDLY